MKLIDMKLPKKPKHERGLAAVASDAGQERYPYGLQISLDNEQLEKLGLKTLPAVGKTLHLSATGVVTQASERDTQGEGVRRQLQIQLQRIGLSEAAPSMEEAIEKGLRDAEPLTGQSGKGA